MCRLPFAKGLTLVELVVVMAILAVLAGVAVRSLEPIADQTRYEATKNTLDVVRDAIVEDRKQNSGIRQVSGFVSDIGRLPESTDMLIDDVGITQFTDGMNTVALSAFDFTDRSGPAASSPPENPTTIDCTGISLRCGWRGPYLTVPSLATGVVDGWGRSIGLEQYPNVGDDFHVVWTAVTSQYSDQADNVQKRSFQTVSGIIQDNVGALKTAEVGLVYPDPTMSTTNLVVMEDADGNDGDSNFRFENVPVGVRALAFKDSTGATQAVRYIEVTPTQPAELTVTITEF